jgi:transposase InsO family protein
LGFAWSYPSDETISVQDVQAVLRIRNKRAEQHLHLGPGSQGRAPLSSTNVLFSARDGLPLQGIKYSHYKELLLHAINHWIRYLADFLFMNRLDQVRPHRALGYATPNEFARAEPRSRVKGT